MRRRSFASDNNAGAHPKVMEAMVAANADHASAYGNDPWTAAMEQQFRRLLGEEARVFLVFGGTGANVLGLKALTSSHHAILSSAQAHIQVDECGAPENYLGCKLVALPTPDGKIRPEQIEASLGGLGNPHNVQPRVVSLSQATELGTVYSLEELRELTSCARAHGLRVHMDGARLANAAASLGASLKEITAGVDVLSFGATKNGLIYGEAVVVFDPQLAGEFAYIRKQGMQLPSKMRFVAAQFQALLEDDLWLANASHANAMARRLAELVQGLPVTPLPSLRSAVPRGGLPGLCLSRPVEANGVFCTIPRAVVAPLQERFPFYVWDEATCEVRWMTSFDTTVEDVDSLVAALKELL